MGDMAGLPALSDPRLILLQRQSRRVRKGTTIQNDKLKAHKTKVIKMVDKQQTSEDFRAWQKTIPLKHNLAEIRGIQKCLRRRRESSTLDPELTPRNGVYDGVSLDAMKSEVEGIIREKNPRERRLRKVERMKNNGYRDGRIVDYDSSMAKFSEVLQRPKGLTRGERPVSSFGIFETSSMPTTPMFDSPLPDTPPAKFRLPPIQARRSTIANTALVTMPHQPTRRFFDTKSNHSDPIKSMKRSMSFAIAQ